MKSYFLMVLLSIFSLLGVSSYAGTITIQFDNQTNNTLTFAPIVNNSSKNCLSWKAQIMTVLPQTKANFEGQLSGKCGFFYAFETQFYLLAPTYKVASASLSCAAEAGGCYWSTKNFPITIHSVFHNVKIDAKDGQVSNPWTLIIVPTAN